MSLWRLFKTLWGQSGQPSSEADVAVAERADGADPEGGGDERWWTAPADALLEMPTPEAPELSTEALALDHLLRGFCERDDLRLPSMPKVAERALRLIESEKSDAHAIAGALEEDQVIAAAVLRLANCSLYAGMERVQNLHTAVARLGRKALSMVLFQHSLAAATSRVKRRDDRLAAFVWNGSLASACIMRELAGLISSDPESAYLNGLLHDLGNVLVLLEAREQETLLRCRIELDAFAWLCRKHHQRLGQAIAAAWNLPDTVQALVAGHHQSLGADAPSARDGAMLALTDMIKSMLGYLPPAAFNLPESKAAETLGLAGSPRLAAMLDAVPEHLGEIAPSF